jgi:hypothetical protein
MIFGNYDLWRQHPIFKANHIKHVFPGLGSAVAIFSVYVVAGNFKYITR